ncbi:hypothetical protein CS0771_53090 [Catellatospora sp. IY07-71]|nr:hypothetical protein CS0771_53090 [Catellatospora sp. IY07-71]
MLGEVGKRLLDQWLTALMLPGLLFVAAAVAATHLRHAAALDLGKLAAWVTAQVTTSAAGTDSGRVLLAVGGALLGAAGAGLCVAVLGRCAAYLWTWPGTRTPLRLATAARLRRWERAGDRVTAAMDHAVATGAVGLAAALAARDRISLVEPTHPTWIGDRLAAPAVRVQANYGLDLAVAWPRLWLLLQDTARTEVSAAHGAYTAASRLAGWAVLYAALGLLWWPGVPIAAVLAATAWVQARQAAATLADLTEAVVDLHGADLAEQLRLGCDGVLRPEVGRAVTELLRKSTLPLPRQLPSLKARRTETRR